MTDDQIIELADTFGIDSVGYDRCIAFAREIEARERKECEHKLRILAATTNADGTLAMEFINDLLRDK